MSGLKPVAIIDQSTREGCRTKSAIFITSSSPALASRQVAGLNDSGENESRLTGPAWCSELRICVQVSLYKGQLVRNPDKTTQKKNQAETYLSSTPPMRSHMLGLAL